jgi:hypothetical protein
MKHIKGFEFTDRRDAAAEAKKALLAKFQPKPAATTNLDEIKAAREAEKERVRQERLAAKEAARLAKIAAEEANKQSAIDAYQQAIEAKRQERKDRKALMKMDAQKKREQNQALRAGRKQNRPDDYGGVGW